MRLNHVLFGAAVLSALFLPACSSEQDPGDFGASSSLSFLVDMAPIQEVGTRAFYDPVLLTDDSDAALRVQLETGPAGVTTRASQATLGGIASVHVTAYDHEGDFGPATTSYAGGFGFVDVEFTVTSNVGTPSPDKYWPFVNRHLSFFAYANESSGMGASPIALTTGYPSFSYTVPAAASQADLLVSENLNQVASVTTDSQRGRVPLTFHHALSAVIFSIGSDMGLGTGSLTVTLSGLKDTGTFTYNVVSPTFGAWSSLSGNATYNLTVTLSPGSDISTMSSDKVLFLLPQDIPAGARLGITYTDPAGVAHSYSATLNTLGIGTWSSGHYYRYTITLNDNALTVGTYPRWTDAGTGFAMDGPVTAYTAGEHFGVFAVDGSGKVVLSNVDMTLDASGRISDGSHFIDKDYTYYVYYPYRSSLSGAPAVGTSASSSASADTFFSSVISNWTVGTTQNTAATFKASDLQVGKATRSGTYFTATMSHKMGLAKITPTSKSVAETLTYNFTTNGSSHTTYSTSTSGSMTVTASSAVSEDTKLYSPSSGIIWTIVKATSTTGNTSVTASSNAGEADYWTLSLTGVGYGKYKNFDVSSPRTFKKFVANFPYNTAPTYYEITLPCRGPFKLEVWGAGGTTNYGDAGLGGYTYGTYTSTNGSQKLYVCVGGMGTHNATGNATGDQYGAYGGYNGGGHGQAGGGGATHIADALVGTGVLSAYSSSDNRDYVLVVAGGAGNANLGTGGHGGGGNGNGTNGMGYTRYEKINGHTENLNEAYTYATGGTASAGGTGYASGSFGQGGHALNGNDSGAGGGGGWFGGGSSRNDLHGNRGTGGGGSGHIHASKITNGGGTIGRTLSDYANGSTNTITPASNFPTGAANDPTLASILNPTVGSVTLKKEAHGQAKITLQ